LAKFIAIFGFPGDGVVEPDVPRDCLFVYCEKLANRPSKKNQIQNAAVESKKIAKSIFGNGVIKSNRQKGDGHN
jgi:hypothetical protein